MLKTFTLGHMLSITNDLILIDDHKDLENFIDHLVGFKTSIDQAIDVLGKCRNYLLDEYVFLNYLWLPRHINGINMNREEYDKTYKNWTEQYGEVFEFEKGCVKYNE